MIYKKLKIKKVLFGFKLDKQVNVKILENMNYLVDNEFLLNLIFENNYEKIHDKENYPYFNGLKAIDMLGFIIKEELSRDLAKTTEIYYRLVEKKKIIEFVESDSFREVFIIEDVLSIIKNALVDLHPFYNTPISILHMGYIDMIEHKIFYDQAIAKKIDYRIEIRTKILKEYFDFLLRLNQKNEFKYNIFRNYTYDKDLDIFNFNMEALSTAPMFVSVQNYIFDISELNKLLQNEKSIYKCNIIEDGEYKTVKMDLFSVGNLDTMLLRKTSLLMFQKDFGFYDNPCSQFRKTDLLIVKDQIDLFFKIDDFNIDLSLSTNFVIYKDKLPAKKEDL